MQAMFPTRNPMKKIRASGFLLLAGSILMLAGFVLHPADHPDAAAAAPVIAANAGVWALAHWLLAAGGVLLAVACFVLARARYGPTRFPAGRRAFLALGVSSVLALEVFVLEATLAVTYGKAGDVSRLEGLLVPEIPGIVGLFGLSAAGVWVFVTQALDDCPVLPKAVNWIAALGAATGFAGSVFYGLGDETLAQLQYGNGVEILALAALAVKALVESSPRKQAAGAGTQG
jgi:hypothetical protein